MFDAFNFNLFLECLTTLYWFVHSKQVLVGKGDGEKLYQRTFANEYNVEKIIFLGVYIMATLRHGFNKISNKIKINYTKVGGWGQR